jgi:hypothetical protein
MSAGVILDLMSAASQTLGNDDKGGLPSLTEFAQLVTLFRGMCGQKQWRSMQEGPFTPASHCLLCRLKSEVRARKPAPHAVSNLDLATFAEARRVPAPVVACELPSLGQMKAWGQLGHRKGTIGLHSNRAPPAAHFQVGGPLIYLAATFPIKILLLQILLQSLSELLASHL